jgi:lambda repressor-like predicted transcriptional regulator
VSPSTAQQLASQARKAREATLRRDALIRQMREEGSSLRSIAEAAELTHTAIAKILAR